ncbi:MAG: hypothetical protein A3F12_03220 [Gammaproteobacteria bacterium RIFCSPHIGHO2_12_FULL_38_14]|nr:MAG: hypothetical protein A3F12_03220 [Gammaproteobacteria bacterium RIFCSPHIGHO2_12_FULL_38_14]
MRKIDPALYDRLNQLMSSMGYELLGYELSSSGGQSMFRLYIDRQNGITLDDCQAVSRQVSAMMDVEDPIQGRYTLEVSSPGVDRPLFSLAHYQQFLGHLIKVKLQGRKQLRGILKRVEGETIYLLIDKTGEEEKLSFSMIDRANLVGDIHFQRAKSAKHKNRKHH